ncbi:Permease of the drug/metabolite transporter (DMT) superfamily [Pseudobutyrivibrio ruminis]|uniref:Permease of the drug/metabolite transporter (DMT) superfamily n=1 Tax=Pseudobutyrivibrio ruminis TaxID=46206 RepID=A0A1H7JRK4_9FIRM|nr:EamA family transporter [Pseudobutyrivibrio ruminis]SEK77203.1 Permease of the drug/metabolite transporter (DMT) superfamily [Pseudobutyrivibrio ruminis]
MKRDYKGILLTIMGASCWGLSGSVGQYLFDVQQMDSQWLVPIRLGMAGIILLIYCLIKYEKETFKPWATLGQSINMLIYGLLGVSCCQFLYFLTIELSNAAIGTILQDLAPIFILLVTCIHGKRLPRVGEICAILLAILGVFFLTTHGNIENLSVAKGALIAGVGSAVCVMIYNVLAPRITSDTPVVIAQAWSFLMGGAFGCLVFRIWQIPYTPNIYGLLGIAFVVLVGNIGAFTLYISGVKRIGPNKASLYSFAEPITAAIIGTTILGNKFTVYDALGFALIFMMLCSITFSKKE